VEAAHFVTAVATNTPFRTDAEEGLRVVEVLERGEQALRMRLNTPASAVPRAPLPVAVR
jgi:hypothetical protein